MAYFNNNVGESPNAHFLGSVYLNTYGDKVVNLNTFRDEVYVHIKDRKKLKTVSLKAVDFLRLLKAKGEIIALIEKGANHINKNKLAKVDEENTEICENSENKMNDDGFDTDTDMDSIVKKLNGNDNDKVADSNPAKSNRNPLTEIQQALQTLIKTNKSKKRAVISSEPSSSDSSEVENKVPPPSTPPKRGRPSKKRKTDTTTTN